MHPWLLQVEDAAVGSSGSGSAQSAEAESEECPAPEPAEGAAPAARPGPLVQHLPPVCLRLRFPRDYPSASPPQVLGLSALWLSAADGAALRRHLAALWDDQVRAMHCAPDP